VSSKYVISVADETRYVPPYFGFSDTSVVVVLVVVVVVTALVVVVFVVVVVVVIAVGVVGPQEANNRAATTRQAVTRNIVLFISWIPPYSIYSGKQLAYSQSICTVSHLAPPASGITT